MKQAHTFNRIRRRFLAGALSLALLAAYSPAVLADGGEGEVSLTEEESKTITEQSDQYQDYLAQHGDAACPAVSVSLPAGAAQADVGDKQNPEGVGEVLVFGKKGDAGTWTAEIPQTGFYHIAVEYAITGSGSKSADVDLLIDGIVPFTECEGLSLSRIWENKNRTITEDASGNQLRPSQVQVQGFFTTDLKNTSYDNERLFFYLEKGVHTLTLRSGNGVPLQIAGLTVYNQESPEPYAQVSAWYENTDALTGVYDVYEAELAPRKSDIVLYPTYDRSSPLTTPYDAVKMRMNTIGQGTWTKAGQWIEWDIEIRKAGYYKIGMRFRQDQMRGMTSSRRIEIDGEVVCSELECYSFPFDTSWQVTSLSDGNEEILFYLTAGVHTIRMEAVWGEIRYSIRSLNKTLTDLNTIYRRIVMITGTIPDTLRDYQLEKQIPDLLTSFRRCAKAMLDEIERIERFSGNVGSDASFLRRFAEQLNDFCDQPDTIPDRLSNFKSNISSLSTLLISLQSQPLELDYLFVASPEAEEPRANANFFEALSHEFKMFIYSFVSDYDAIGSSGEQATKIRVWLTMGRDQASIVKNIIDDSFVPNSNIGVELSLIQGSISEPVMAGKGPDVVIGIGRSLVADLAARGVVHPLDGFSEFDEIAGRFQKTALVPYMYNGGTYALPETQEFNMMFVRTDIFGELGLSIPESWGDIVNQIGIIQQNNLNIGLVNGVHSSVTSALNSGLPSILTALLLQNGMTYYNRDLTGTVFSEDRAINVYREFTSYFTDLSCTVYFDAVNQFRTGEMPLIIAPLSTYNSLYIAAPEIKGLWTMLPIPGKKETDGQGNTALNIAEDAIGSGTLIFKDCEDPESAWEFLKFWSSAQTQSRFASELEMLLGTGGRYMTANTEAFYGLSWSEKELESLQRQRDAVQEYIQLPGNYIITRNLTNAFVSIMDGANSRDTIMKYAMVMDSELRRKHEEFNYKTGDDYYAHK